MRSALLIMITCTSCTLPIETVHQLRVEPAAIALDVDLAAPAPAGAPHAVAGGF